MPNVPIVLPEDACNSESTIPDCVQNFLNTLAPIKAEEVKNTFKAAWQSLSQTADAQASDYISSIDNFLKDQKKQEELAKTLDQLENSLKCPGDADSCGSLSETVNGVKNSLNAIKSQLQLYLGDKFLQDGVKLAESLTKKFLTFATFEGIGFECPKEELDANTAAEEQASSSDNAFRPQTISNLQIGPPIGNSILLRWDTPEDTSNLLGYKINLNNFTVAIVPYFFDEFILRDLPNDIPYKIEVIPFNTDSVPVTSQPSTLCNITAGNPIPVPTPIITNSLSFDGGFYTEWQVDPDIIDINDFNNQTYNATIVDNSSFFIVINHDFNNIIEIRNDSYAGYNIYDLSGADISIGSTFRVTLDLFNPINQNIGLNNNDLVEIIFQDRQDAKFINISSGLWTVQLLNSELSSDIPLIDVNEIRIQRPLDGELHYYDLDNIQIINHNSFTFNAPEAQGFDYLITLQPNLQSFTTDEFDEITFNFLISGSNLELIGIVNSIDPLEIGVDELGTNSIPSLVSISNITKNNQYILSGSNIQLGRNFKIGAFNSDLIQVVSKIKRKPDYINSQTGLLTLIGTSFTNIFSIENITRGNFYTLSGSNIFKGSTLIKLDPLNQINATIGMREDDLIRVKSNDAAFAKFLIDDPDSNSLTWKLELQNFELGSVGFIKEIRSIINLDRPGQFYDLTNVAFIDNYIILEQSDGLNEQLGIDPRDRILVDYTWERFNTVKAYEVFVDDGLGYQFRQRTGLNTSFFDIGGRALLQGATREPFTIIDNKNSFKVIANLNEEEIELTPGNEIDLIEIIDEINTKSEYIFAANASGSLILGVKNIIQRNPLSNNLPIQVQNQNACLQNGSCLINDYIQLSSGSVLDVLGFSAGEEGIGISYQNDNPIDIKVEAITKDNRRTPFSLAGTNYTRIIPSRPIFEFNNLSINAIQPGYIYNSNCGDPTDIACYLQSTFAWVINFGLESLNRELYQYERLIKATIINKDNQEISIPTIIYSLDDILSIQKTTDFLNFSSYDLTNLSITVVSGSSLTIINLDQNLVANQSLGMNDFDQIGIIVPDFYKDTGILNNIPNILKTSLTPLPTLEVNGMNINSISSNNYNLFGIDPYVKIRNLKSELLGYNPNASGISFTVQINSNFEATSAEGVESASIWVKSKRKTLIPAMNLGSPLILTAGKDDPYERGLYSLQEEITFDVTTPIYSSVLAVSAGSISYLLDKDNLITSNGLFSGWILEFKSGVKSGKKYKIETTSISPYRFTINANLSGVKKNDIVVLHQREFPNAWPNPAGGSFDVTTASPIPGKFSDLFDPDDGYILLTQTKDNTLLTYGADSTRNTLIYLSTEAIRFNQNIRANSPFNLSNLGLIKFSETYKPLDINFIDSQNWNCNLLITGTNSNPQIILNALGKTELGEDILGQQIINI